MMPFTRPVRLPFAAMISAVLLAGPSLPAADVFVATDTLSYARSGHAAVLLADGRAMIAGGIGYGGTYARCEFYQPATSTWVNAPALDHYRRHHTLTVLANGKVLAAGGFDDYNVPEQAELYDPALNTWTPAGSLTNVRHFHRATLLADGKVMVTGGRHVADGIPNTTYPTRVEIYNPATGAWSSTSALAAGRANHSATLLANGKVLVAGGQGSGGYLSGAVLYNPATGTWSTTGTMSSSRAQHTATLLANGKVLVAGGFSGSHYLDSTELYDPATGTWTASGSMATSRCNHTATALPDGRILLAGGASSATAFPVATDFYHPATGTCSPAPTLVSSRQLHTATLLSSGEVLLAGGTNTTGESYLGSSELYDTPTVTTPNSSLVTGTTARIGGNVTKIGSAAMTGRGVVFSPAAVNDTPALGGPGVTAVATTGTTGSFTVDVTGLQPGTAYRFRAYATNGVGTGYNATGSFTTLTPLETWRKTWYGVTTNTGDAADDADPHHTGIPNLMVFGLIGPDQNPALAKPSQLPQLQFSDGILGYLFAEPAGVGTLIYRAQTSPDLAPASWQPVPDASTASGFHAFVVLAGPGPKGFLRLTVSRP